MSDRNERKVICLIGNVLKERYCIVEQIGHGGGGSLYLAKDMELGICRAVKEIPIAKKKEARLMQHLEYPAIPKIIDYVETGEYCYLIMEYIKGQSLGELLRSGKRFSLREILALGKEIARVLEYLHSRKPPVCYGDLKPDNLMFSETGHLYLIDLGSAMFDHGKRKQICEGTKGYAAPEQYQGYLRPEVIFYALGKTLGKAFAEKRNGSGFLYPDFFWLLFPMYQKTGKIQIFGYVSGSEENPKAGKQISDDHLEKTISGSGSCRDSDRNTDLDSRIAENGRIFCGDLRSNRFVLRSQTVSGRLKRSGKVLYGSGKETPEVK